MRYRTLPLAASLIALFVAFASASESFLSPRNLSMLAIELSITAVLALGMLLVLLLGLIDLSAGSGVGLVGGIASVLVFRHDLPAGLAMLIGALTAIAVWAAMGALIVRQKMPAFIITLGGLLVFKGLFWLVIRNATVPVARGSTENALSMLTTYFLPRAAGFTLAAVAVTALLLLRMRRRRARVAHGLSVEDRESFTLQLIVTAQAALLLLLVLDRFRGVPVSLVILGVAAAAIHTLTQHTPFGRYLYAIGDNPEAARLSGIAVEKTIVVAFAMMGVVVALTGCLQTAYAGASTTTVGDLMELDAIAACVIGGTSLRGGRGSVAGVLFGALIMATLLNGMTLLAVPPELKLIARGSVLVLAVWLDVTLARRSARS
ncbi:MAG: ATPase [Deltaproteobacteria bacterium]|nr:ATPase [Deltaproteobacteria bacterium]